MINQVFEQALKQLEADRQRECEAARQKCMQEQVAPNNAKIDASAREALAKLQKEHSEEMATLNAQYEEEKSAILEAAQNKKKEFETQMLDLAVSVINHNTDSAISHLQQYLDKQGM